MTGTFKPHSPQAGLLGYVFGRVMGRKDGSNGMCVCVCPHASTMFPIISHSHVSAPHSLGTFQKFCIRRTHPLNAAELFSGLLKSCSFPEPQNGRFGLDFGFGFGFKGLPTQLFSGTLP